MPVWLPIKGDKLGHLMLPHTTYDNSEHLAPFSHLLEDSQVHPGFLDIFHISSPFFLPLLFLHRPPTPTSPSFLLSHHYHSYVYLTTFLPIFSLSNKKVKLTPPSPPTISPICPLPFRGQAGQSLHL